MPARTRALFASLPRSDGTASAGASEPTAAAAGSARVTAAIARSRVGGDAPLGSLLQSVRSLRKTAGEKA